MRTKTEILEDLKRGVNSKELFLEVLINIRDNLADELSNITAEIYRSSGRE